jgi:acyl-CoA thioesterase-1
MNRPATAAAHLLPVLALLAGIGCSRGDKPEARDESRTAVTTASGRGGQEAPAAEPASLPRIVFLGDSLTAGLGLAREDAVPAVIQRRLTREGYAYEVVNAGNSGDTSDGGLSRLDWSLAGSVAVLVVELGANDGLRGLPPQRTRQNLETIVRTAKQRGIKVLLTGMEAPPNYGAAYTDQFRQTFKSVAAGENVAFMPFFLDGVAGIARLNQSDGIHPTPEGARIIADNLWPYLQPLLQKPTS